MKSLLTFLLFCLSLSGCYSDYGVTPISDPVTIPDFAPDIDVTPGSHQFGALNAVGESDTIVVTISNKLKNEQIKTVICKCKQNMRNERTNVIKQNVNKRAIFTTKQRHNNRHVKICAVP